LYNYQNYKTFLIFRNLRQYFFYSQCYKNKTEPPL